MARIRGNFFWVAALLLILTSGCQSAYYATMEKLGFPKRDLLVDRVEDARDAQENAKEQFQSAYEEFKALVNFEGGKLEERYETLKGAYDESRFRAEAVHERINAVGNVAGALFEEWEEELSRYTREDLQRKSRRKLETTRGEYRRLMQVMRRAEKKMDPVLAAFQDQVLFLKHNLNARAVASLRTEATAVENEITLLIEQMNASIQEANEFIQAMTRE